MKYACLLRPYANSRYQAGAIPLAIAELQVILKNIGRETEIEARKQAGADWLSFECESLSADEASKVGRCAHVYLMMEEREDGWMKPVSAGYSAYLGEDLPYVLKYKGKTNETFTRFLINMACASSTFSPDQPLRLLDPMCGRGTTLFEAVNCGWNASGVDVQASDIDEAEKFFKRYLEYHRIKHGVSRKSMTADGKEIAVVRQYEFAREASAFKRGDVRTLSLTQMDSGKMKRIWNKPFFHLVVSDLPYGVQHAPGGQKRTSLQQMVRDVLPTWRDLLLPGGAIALSFNVNTLRQDFMREVMADVGLKVMTGPGYDGLEHWVEQAISRDVAVAVRE